MARKCKMSHIPLADFLDNLKRNNNITSCYTVGRPRQYKNNNIIRHFCPTFFNILMDSHVQGEEVYGMFRLSPNGRNVRDLDIEIDVDFAVSFTRIF